MLEAGVQGQGGCEAQGPVQDHTQVGRHNIFRNFSERSLKLEITFKRREDPKTRNDVKCSGKK